MKKKEYKMPQAIVVTVSEAELLLTGSGSTLGIGSGGGSGSVGAPERSLEELDELEHVYDDLFK